MNFNTKYNNFTIKYTQIKNSIVHYVKDNIIKIGSGGSDNIIIIENDIVMKIIPIKINNKIKNDKDTLEYKFYEILYDKFLKTNITPHIVGMYKKYKINITKFFPNNCTKNIKSSCCPTLDDIIMGKKITYVENHLCSLKNAYGKKIIHKTADCLLLENCPTNISNEITKILYSNDNHKHKILLINNLLNRIIFQIIYTLAQIQKYNKNFIHNDLFLRNVLATNDYNYKTTEYIEYIFDKKSYYLQANGLYIKINDFGYALNLENIKTSLIDDINTSLITNSLFEVKNNKRDIYTFLTDLYSGSNIDGDSLNKLINDNIPKQYITIYNKNTSKTINNFINLDVIDKIIQNNLNIMNISDSKLLLGSVKVPKDYFKTSVFNMYKKLPVGCTIIKTYQ
jgi:hypothetical protein